MTLMLAGASTIFCSKPAAVTTISSSSDDGPGAAAGSWARAGPAASNRAASETKPADKRRRDMDMRPPESCERLSIAIQALPQAGCANRSQVAAAFGDRRRYGARPAAGLEKADERLR